MGAVSAAWRILRRRATRWSMMSRRRAREEGSISSYRLGVGVLVGVGGGVRVSVGERANGQQKTEKRIRN